MTSAQNELVMQKRERGTFLDVQGRQTGIRNIHIGLNIQDQTLNLGCLRPMMSLKYLNFIHI